ncbi:MAG: helix-turn-helix transcriptional regulator [Solobacterium sp.]|nr:helix-turn-helix transcriptional regulator [Solobacterium sp.]
MKEATVVRLKDLMKTKGLTANNLSILSGITPSTLYSLLKEERKDVSVNTVKKLCDGMGMTIREFFNSDLFDDLEVELR